MQMTALRAPLMPSVSRDKATVENFSLRMAIAYPERRIASADLLIHQALIGT
jgi:hypothetical protein